MKMLVDLKPIHLYLSDDVLGLLYKMSTCFPADNRQVKEGEQTGEDSMVQIDFVYISDISIVCRSTSKTMMNAVKYLPNVSMNISVR